MRNGTLKKLSSLVLVLVFGAVLVQSNDAKASARRCDTKIWDVGVKSNGDLTIYFKDIRYIHPHPQVPPQQLTLKACNVKTDAHCGAWQKLLTAAVLTQKLVLVNLSNSRYFSSCSALPQTGTTISYIRLTKGN